MAASRAGAFYVRPCPVHGHIGIDVYTNCEQCNRVVAEYSELRRNLARARIKAEKRQRRKAYKRRVGGSR